MVHKKKREPKDAMKSFEEDLKRFGVEVGKEESEEDWVDRQKKEYERQAKEAVEMYQSAVRYYAKAQKIARDTARALKKGRAFVQERILHREPTRRPIRVTLPPKKEKEEIEYGEW
jgi:hypothetical protein